MLVAVSLEGWNMDEEVRIDEAWVRGSRGWLDVLLARAIGEEATEGIKGGVRCIMADLADVRIDWNDRRITCSDRRLRRYAGLLRARPTDTVGLALLRVALIEESGGLIRDVDSTAIYVATEDEDLAGVAMQAFKRVIMHHRRHVTPGDALEVGGEGGSPPSSFS